MTAEWRAMHEQNRKSWNAVAAAHNSHKRDQGEFLATGGSTLFPDER
ncbi:MAG: SAM-dependent methyltransferase, partial [Planctomycetota bacterium]|nr:SAM-dependent methyltransferase [Planctomycetota bacterium]